jgi:ribonuclease HI
MQEELDVKIQTEEEEKSVANAEQPQDKEAKEEISMIEIYTDGACSGNPGPGGYAAILIKDNEIIKISGGHKLTTNNKMELMGAIEGLKAIPDKNMKVKVFTDSTYVQKGITEWIETWKKKHFKDVKNVELWKELDAISNELNIEWHWVKAHAGHEHNEMADALAKLEVEKNR